MHLVQILEYADLAGAEVLRAYCLAVAVCNLVRPLLLHSLPLHAALLQPLLQQTWYLTRHGPDFTRHIQTQHAPAIFQTAGRGAAGGGRRV